MPRGSHSADKAVQNGITAFKFDDSHDLIWLGDSSGYLYSFYGMKLQPYVSCRVCQGQINQILGHKKGVLTLSSKGVRLGTVEGISIYRVICSKEHGGLRCMTYTSNTQTEVYAGGRASSTGSRIFKIDLVNGKVSGCISYSQDLVFMTCNLQYVIFGRSDGCVDVFDPKSERVVKTFRCHSASLSSIFIHDNILMTTGYSLKKDRFVPDPLVNRFDLQTLDSIPPYPFPAGPTHVYLHPRILDLALIASNMGQFHFVDISNPAKLHIYQADLSTFITLMDISDSGDYFAFIDGMQNLHLWARVPDPMSPLPNFTVYGKPVKFPSVNNEVIPMMNRLNFESAFPPLNGIKLPHYDEMLLSAWPPDAVFKVGAVPKPIDYEILRGVRKVQTFNIAHYDKDKFGSRNIVTKYEKQKKLNIPKFISEKDSDQSDDENESHNSEQLQDFAAARDMSLPASSSSNRTDNISQDKIYPKKQQNVFETVSDSGELPNAFKLMRIAYSKFGVDDFDFEYFNNTRFTGLEADAGNTYTNSIIQLYKYNPPLYNYISLSLREDVADEDILLVELGYLFDKSLNANGHHCAPSNFQRVLSTNAEARKLGLITENECVYDSYGQRKLVQVFNRFLLEQISRDEQYLYTTTEPVRLDSLCGVSTETRIVSKFCSLERSFSTVFHSIDINVLPVSLNAPASLTIVDYIQASMSKAVSRPINCDVCGKRHPIDASLHVRSLPADLILNIDLTDEQLVDIRFLKGWLVPEFYVARTNDGSSVLFAKRESVPSQVPVRRYDITGLVVQITDRVNRSHLVTLTKVPDKTGKLDKESWCLFNDFLVTEVSQEEALDLSYWWKKPVVIMYKAVDTEDKFVYDCWRQNLDVSILYKDHFARGTREGKIIEYKLLTHDEPPLPGTMVAIDAEFVQIAPQEFEISFHRPKKLVKPKRLVLGRISVLKCDGKNAGECFIDDYIVAKEHIDDYITSFSGIEPGDLDPDKSKRTLVTLQTAYRKMWLLLNLGCIFVGHSLKGDFRMINIQVPPEQVRDTAELFYLKKEKRKLSLKYLIYQLFKDNVQVGNHDSIEDADSAMRAYRKYLELKSNGTFEDILQRIYLEGQMSQFRIPQ